MVDGDGITPSGTKVYAIAPNGKMTDVTVGVQSLYDLLIQSMDWGSGFLSAEDARPIAELARTCGFEGLEEAERYLHDQTLWEARRSRV